MAHLPRTQFTRSNAPNPCGSKTAKFSHLHMHSYPYAIYKRQTRHGSKTSTQNFRISAWHSYPERAPATMHSFHTRAAAGHARQRAQQPLSGGSGYCACHCGTVEAGGSSAATTRATAPLSRLGPGPTPRAAALSGGSDYCACSAPQRW